MDILSLILILGAIDCIDKNKWINYINKESFNEYSIERISSSPPFIYRQYANSENRELGTIEFEHLSFVCVVIDGEKI